MLLPGAVGDRSEGWHEVQISVTYPKAGDVDWEFFVDEVCDGFATEAMTIQTFRLGHDNYATYADNIQAWTEWGSTWKRR